MKLEEQGYAIDDASSYSRTGSVVFLLTFGCTAKAIQLDPRYVKAYYRYIPDPGRLHLPLDLSTAPQTCPLPTRDFPASESRR